MGKFLNNKILIIDDDDIIIQVLKMLFRDETFVIDYCQSVEEALSRDFTDYDVILSDINLPGLSGIDLLKKVHEIDIDIPVILITGMGDIDTAINAVKEGAFDYIQKPFSHDQISISVKKAKDKRDLILQNRYYYNELKEKNLELKNLNNKIYQRNIQIENDLDIAKNLQNCLFPLELPEIEGFNFHFRYKSFEKVSGDFFYIEKIHDKILIMLADVSGHGVSAALYTAMMKSALISTYRSNTLPAVFMDKMNQFLLNAQQEPSYTYAAVFCLELDLKRNKLTFTNCGVPAPVLIRKSGEIIQLKPNSPFVGIFQDAHYEQTELDMFEGDKYIAFSDGTFENYNHSDIFNAYAVLMNLITEKWSLDLKEIVDSVYDNIIAYCNNEESDDITILGIENIRNKLY